MTPKEAIEILMSDEKLAEIEYYGGFEGQKKVAKLYSEAFDMAIEALEKQIPKKVKKEILTSNAFTQWRKYNCPNCGCFLYSGSSKPFSAQPHCYRCGQALDWGEEE